jgi:hypothetical protein
MITFGAVDEYFEQMFNVARRVHAALTQAGIDYRIVGGVAVFLHVNELDPLAARLTPDVDVTIHRKDPEALRDRLDQVRKEERQSTGAE